MSQQQLMLQEENSSFVEQREKEIQNVVRSIYELNSIFKVNFDKEKQNYFETSLNCLLNSVEKRWSRAL